jgi:hypothetical protein
MLDAVEPAPQQRQQNPPASQEAPGQAAPQGQPAGSEQPNQVSPYDPVTAKAVNILKNEFGLSDFDPTNLDQDEEEFKLLDMETDDPEKFFTSVRAYGKAKADKAQQAGSPSRLPGLGSGGGPSSTPAHANQRGSQILDDYYRSKPT